jgi:hypothetical protein
MTPRPHVPLDRDKEILALIGLAIVITVLVDALGWFRTGLFFNR